MIRINRLPILIWLNKEFYSIQLKATITNFTKKPSNLKIYNSSPHDDDRRRTPNRLGISNYETVECAAWTRNLFSSSSSVAVCSRCEEFIQLCRYPSTAFRKLFKVLISKQALLQLTDIWILVILSDFGATMGWLHLCFVFVATITGESTFVVNQLPALTYVRLLLLNLTLYRFYYTCILCFERVLFLLWVNRYFMF